MTEVQVLEHQDVIDRIEAPRPAVISGTTVRFVTHVGTLFMTVNYADGKPYEVFLNIGKGGADVTADAEGYGRLLALLFKAGVPIETIVDQLRGIGGGGSIGFGVNRVRSLPDAIAKVLEMHLAEPQIYTGGVVSIDQDMRVEEAGVKLTGKPKQTGNFCPDCNTVLIYQEGCSKCPCCGYSVC